jgi:hypothetical protein
MKYLFPAKSKPWYTYVRRTEDFITVEITDPPFVWKDHLDLYIDLLDRIFQDYQIVALSQMIDERQWWKDIGDRCDYVDAIRQRFSVQAAVTACYDKPDLPGETSHSFVVHVVGRLDRSLLRELLGFGMTDLPNIAYGLRSMPESWLLEILSWNKVFVGWFRLREPDTTLVRLIEQTGLLFWTADGHLSFGLSNDSGVERILAFAEDLAQEWGLSPVIDCVIND